MTAEWSALDTLRHTVLRAEDMISTAVDYAAGNLEIDDDDPLLGMLDTARKMLVDGLAEQIAGVEHDGVTAIYTPEARRRVYRYDDGSPVIRVFEDDGLTMWHIFPRLEPELLDAKNRLAVIDPEFAAIVNQQEGEDG
jgi:hypothetical protein